MFCGDVVGFVQLTKANDQHAAAGRLLDKVSDKLDEDERMAFDQLVYALVRTDQLKCARWLDAELTEQYCRDGGPEHG